ncbi:MAG TPA: ABC transporter permease [Firmicutes bacterium]|nr:ABC transporter permease [Bacillota bacterium]
MQVFKAYLKVIRSSIGSLVIPFGVFLSIALLVGPAEEATQYFTPTKVPIAVINRDTEGIVAQGLVDYLDQTFRLMSYPDDPQLLQDALFYRSVEYVVIIPAGFSAGFLAGEKVQIEKVIVPASSTSFYVDLAVNRFLNTLRLYRDYGPQGSPGQLVQATLGDLRVETRVSLYGEGPSSTVDKPYSFYFRYSAYALLGMITMGVSTVMLAFNRRDLLLRNYCAPLPRRQMHLQLFLGHGVFALGSWILVFLPGLLLYGRKSLLPMNLLGLYALNTVIFAVVCATIGFMVGSLVKNRNIQPGVVNVLSIGMNFLGGVFVPQAFMSDSVLAVARFLPSYWFVRACDLTASLTKLNPSTLRPIYGSMLIQLGFAVAIFSVTLLLTKERKLSQF